MTNSYLQNLIDKANDESTVATGGDFSARIGGGNKIWHLIAALLLKIRIP
jgi:hypothetical protein